MPRSSSLLHIPVAVSDRSWRSPACSWFARHRIVEASEEGAAVVYSVVSHDRGSALTLGFDFQYELVSAEVLYARTRRLQANTILEIAEPGVPVLQLGLQQGEVAPFYERVRPLIVFIGDTSLLSLSLSVQLEPVEPSAFVRVSPNLACGVRDGLLVSLRFVDVRNRRLR